MLKVVANRVGEERLNVGTLGLKLMASLCRILVTENLQAVPFCLCVAEEFKRIVVSECAHAATNDPRSATAATLPDDCNCDGPPPLDSTHG